MPWKETCPLLERMKFVLEWRKGEESRRELCRRYGISPTTGYKWASRFDPTDPSTLRDRSRAPRNSPHATPADVEEQILAARRQHPRWGPQKLRDWLERKDPVTRWPAPSTIGELLRRNGLVAPRRRRRGVPPSPMPWEPPVQPNAVWTADYKGHFRTGDGQYCYPLTVLDSHSRYLLRCQALASTRFDEARPVFEAAFREYGLPQAIRTDNGVPFAARSLSGLSRLAVWWVRLGIQPERIQPGHPEQNGRHERMHRTLKAETALPPKRHRGAQQKAFHHFRREYNEERPHEALGQRCPADVYQASPRPYPARLPELEYPGHFFTRTVGGNGQISFRRHLINIGVPLGGELLGLEEIHDGCWVIHFSWLAIGVLDERQEIVVTDSALFPTNRH